MTSQYTDQQLIDRGILEIAPSGYLRTPPGASFTLIAEGARDNWLAARAAQDIGACIPRHRLCKTELDALILYCESVLRERDEIAINTDKGPF
jgi:hypothetical protein